MILACEIQSVVNWPPRTSHKERGNAKKVLCERKGKAIRHIIICKTYTNIGLGSD